MRRRGSQRPPGISVYFLTSSAKFMWEALGESSALENHPMPVIPAKAGIHLDVD
jgi:hypothetical protein